MKKIKSGSLVVLENGCSGIIKNINRTSMHFLVFFDNITGKLSFHIDVPRSRVLEMSRANIDGIYRELLVSYTNEFPGWHNYTHETTYFEVLDWLWEKVAEDRSDYHDDLADILQDIAIYIVESDEEDIQKSSSASSDQITMNDIAEVAFDNSWVSKELPSPDTVYKRLSKFIEDYKNSNIAEDRKEHLMNIVWSCLGVLHMHGEDLDTVFEDKCKNVSNL